MYDTLLQSADTGVYHRLKSTSIYCFNNINGIISKTSELKSYLICQCHIMYVLITYIYIYDGKYFGSKKSNSRVCDTTLTHIPTSVIFIISTMCYGRGDIIRKMFFIIAIELAKIPNLD